MEMEYNIRNKRILFNILLPYCDNRVENNGPKQTCKLTSLYEIFEL